MEQNTELRDPWWSFEGGVVAILGRESEETWVEVKVWAPCVLG